MSSETYCTRCGAAVSSKEAGGACAACLLEEGMAAAEVTPIPVTLRYFGDYELIEEIARGGMGVVFKARQCSLNRLVAVKMILSGHLASETQAQRFRAEARAAAALQHPGIVAIHEVGEHEGLLFFSMTYVPGRNLAQLVHEGTLSAVRAAECVRAIAEAIQYAHERGVLHRDLKPSNVLIDADGHPHVTDFGLAKQLGSDAQRPTHEPSLTLSGQVLGSPNFMSPEQAAGKHRELSPASDIYSLGALLYHLVTGRPPFLADSVPATLRLVAETEPVSPRLLVPGVPRDLETICLKCLEKEPGRRYATAQELADDLGRFSRLEPIMARPAGVVLRVHRWCMRNRSLAVALTTVLALLVVVAAGSFIAALRIDRERKQARANERKAQTEAARSQQVAKFLQEMLKSAGPSVSRGRDAAIVREILEATSARAGSELKNQPEVQGDIYGTIGNTFVDIGEHRRAITNFEQAVSSYRLAFQGDHPNLAATLSALGFCQSFTEDVARGNNNARLGLEMARRCAGPEVLFNSLWRYAGSFRGWGMFPAESEPYLREAYELKRRLGNDPVGLASAMHLYAGVMTNAAGSEQMLRDGLDLFRKHLPPGHPKTIQGIFNLGQQLVSGRKYEAATPVMTEALQGFHKIHAPNHPYQSIVLRYLIHALVGEGRIKEAESELREHTTSFPGNINYYYMLARFRMRYGSPGGATEALPQDLLAKLERGEFCAPWAVSLLHVGADDKYREYRRLYLDAAFGRKDFRGKMEVAKAFSLFAGDTQEVERSSRFAELAITNASSGDRDYLLEELNALLDLRRGRFDSADALATRVINQGGDWVPRLGESFFIKALACARLQQPRAARRALERGELLLNERLPDASESYLYAGDEWMVARYLGGQARKAVAAIQPTSPQAEEPDDAADLAGECIGKAEDFARRGQWQEASTELAQAIRLTPKNHLLLRKQGEICGRMGRWQEAAESLRGYLDAEPRNAWPYLRLAPVLLLRGDEQGYRKLCSELVTRFSGTQDIAAADTVAKACSLHPRSNVDFKVAAEAADTAVTLGRQTEYLPWFELCKALAEYRQQNFAEAAGWAGKSLAAEGQIVSRDAAAFLVLAMARKRLGQDSAARDALGKANEVVEKKLPRLDGGDLGNQWVDVIIAHLLLREARPLIEVNATSPSDR